MAVRKAMRWSPWAPAAAEGGRKYRVRVTVRRVEGLFLGSAADDGGDGGGPRAVSVEIRWKGSPRSRGLSYLRGRRKPARCALAASVVRDGAAEWGDDEDAASDNVSGFSVVERDGSFGGWDVSFHLLCGKGDAGEKKPEEIGTAMLNLGDLLCQLRTREEKEFSEEFQFQRELPIALRSGCAGTRLSVAVRFVEIRPTREMSEPALQAKLANERNQKPEANVKQSRGDLCAFDSDASDGTQQELQLPKATSGEDSGDQSCSRSPTDAEGGSSSVAQSRSPPKRGLLSWRKRRRKTAGDSDGGEGREGLGASPSSKCSASLDDRDTPISALDAPGGLPIGIWEQRELISRDGQSKLNASTFFASIDQRDESAGGESACTALVVVIADALQSNQMNTPTSSQFDALIREGSSEWRKLCDMESYTDRFPDKHFDLDTVLEAQLRPVSVSPEKSYVGFFQPQSFESLRGAMSFDDIWEDVAGGVEEGKATVYIVSWNDHFFLLKVEADAFYVIDTLGERLFEGCDKAYILRFDNSASMRRVPETEGDEGELLCGGKDCCREFINRFLAAIPLREELAAEEKRGERPSCINALHQRLQIEFHLVQAYDRTEAKTALDDDSTAIDLCINSLTNPLTQ